MSKLVLSEVSNLLLANGYTYEIVPGYATNGDLRHHMLIEHPGVPSLHITFGATKLGSMLDSVYMTTIEGDKIRVKESEFASYIAKPAKQLDWRRDAIPVAEGPNTIPAGRLNMDLGKIAGWGEVIEVADDQVVLTLHYADESNPLKRLTLKVDSHDLAVGKTVAFHGVIHLDSTVTEVTFV